MPRRPVLSFPFGPWVASTARVAWIVGWLGLLRALPAESPPTNSLPLQMALEEGAWREEVSGHYNGAIRIHEQLLERPALPDRIRVEALHRLGICYSMKGNFTPAVARFLQVVREFPNAEPFSQKASHNLLLLSPESNPSDRSWFRDERLFLGDLALVLDAALTHSETPTAREAIGEAVGALRMMRRQLMGDDLQSADRTLAALESLEASLDAAVDPSPAPPVRTARAGPRAVSSQAVWTQGKGRAWMLDRAPLFAPDDANAAILECRDRLARALVAQDAAEVRRQAGRAARWAEPVVQAGRDSLTGSYLGLVEESMAAVAARASAGRFAEARSVWFQSTRTLNRAFGAFTLHVPGLSDFPEEVRPALVAVLIRIEEALHAIESPDEGADPLVPMSEALTRLRGIEAQWGAGRGPTPSVPAAAGPDSPGRQRLRRWAEDWTAIIATLRAGDLPRARQLLQPYEL